MRQSRAISHEPFHRDFSSWSGCSRCYCGWDHKHFLISKSECKVWFNEVIDRGVNGATWCLRCDEVNPAPFFPWCDFIISENNQVCGFFLLLLLLEIEPLRRSPGPNMLLCIKWTDCTWQRPNTVDRTRTSSSFISMVALQCKRRYSRFQSWAEVPFCPFWVFGVNALLSQQLSRVEMPGCRSAGAGIRSRDNLPTPDLPCQKVRREGSRSGTFMGHVCSPWLASWWRLYGGSQGGEGEGRKNKEMMNMYREIYHILLFRRRRQKKGDQQFYNQYSYWQPWRAEIWPSDNVLVPLTRRLSSATACDNSTVKVSAAWPFGRSCHLCCRTHRADVQGGEIAL